MGKSRMLSVQYDEVAEEVETGWWLTIDGKDYYFPQKSCMIDMEECIIEAPQWMVANNGLDLYVIE